MSTDLLRLILIIAGIGLILGIYFWERHKRADASVHAIRRQRDFDEVPLDKDVEQEVPVSVTEASDALSETVEALPVENIPDETAPTPAFLMDDARDSGESDISEELERLNGLVSEKETASTGEQLPFFFASDDEEDEAEPEPQPQSEKIILINVKAKASEGRFPGQEVQEAALAAGLVHGEMEIFHRLNSSASSHTEEPLYSMASMVEPGIFPRDRMDEFSTPGLALFLQLPNQGDGLALFNEMLATAEQLAQRLGGELQDETHSVLTKQTTEHIRGEIIEFQRQQRLAQITS